MEWTHEAITRLRGLWSEGHSTAEIGRRMGVTKNAIVGKAHRLDLPGRPSPIRHEPAGQPRRRAAPRRITGPTLPSLAACPVAPPIGAIGSAAPLLRPGRADACAEDPLASRFRSPADQATPPPIGRDPSDQARAWSAARPGRRQIPCCWPIGEPGTPGFRFCDAAAVTGKPYCDAHAQLAYVRVRDPRVRGDREDAA